MVIDESAFAFIREFPEVAWTDHHHGQQFGQLQRIKRRIRRQLELMAYPKSNLFSPRLKSPSKHRPNPLESAVPTRDERRRSVEPSRTPLPEAGLGRHEDGPPLATELLRQPRYRCLAEWECQEYRRD